FECRDTDGMTDPHDPSEALAAFLAESHFMRHGGVMTDLDGTAVHEADGRVYVSAPMEAGLKRMDDLGRTGVISSLRFPASVIHSFGEAWYRIANAPVPVVSLRGSQCGFLVQRPASIAFEEIDATCLDANEIAEMVRTTATLLDGGLREVLVF